MEEFPSNAHNPKPPPKEETPERQKRVEKVVTGAVITRKPPLSRRFKETFFGGGAEQGVWEYVLFDVIIPASRDMVADAGVQFIERVIFGEARSTSRRGYGRPMSTSTGMVQYNSFSRPGTRPDPRNDLSRTARANHNFNEIIVTQRHIAEEVVDKLYLLLERYNQVTVADFYDACGISPQPPDFKYGWDDLSGTRVERVRDGYLINISTPKPLR